MAIDNKLYYDIASSYGDYYQDQGVSLALWNDKFLIYSALNNSNSESNFNVKEIKNYYITFDNIRYIKIAKPLPQPYSNITVANRSLTEDEEKRLLILQDKYTYDDERPKQPILLKPGDYNLYFDVKTMYTNILTEALQMKKSFRL